MAAASKSPADASPSVGIFSFFSFAAQSSPREEDEAFARAGRPLEEAAYTSGTKALRYMTFGKLAKFIVSHIVTHFLSESTSSADDAEGPAAGREYISNSAEVHGKSRPRGAESASPFSTDDYYGQLATHVVCRDNKTPSARSPPAAAGDPTPGIAYGKPADVANSTESAPRCHIAPVESRPVRLSPSPVRLREFLARWGEISQVSSADDFSKCQSVRDSRQEVFAGILSVEKLARLDAGVYVRPDLSEILATRQEPNQVQSILRQCKSIDSRIIALGKKASFPQAPSDGKVRRARKRADDAVENNGGDGETPTGDTSWNLRTEGRIEVLCTSREKSSTGNILCGKVSMNTRNPEKEGTLDNAVHAVAASAEIVVLRHQKQQLRRQLADVRALAEYLWKYWGLSHTSRMDAEQFSRAFCSNAEDASQQHAAAVLFDLCDTDRRGSVTFEDLFCRLPLLAMEAMFIVTEMERKARQAYRYFWI